MNRKFYVSGLVAAFSLVICTTCLAVEDRLIVTDAQGAQKVSLRDDGTLMLNTATWAGANWPKIYGAGDGNVGFQFDSYYNGADAVSTSAGGGAIFGFNRGAIGNRKAVQLGDRVGFFVFAGYDGTNPINTAGFTAIVDGPVTTGRVPIKLVFETNPAGFPRQERLVIASNGNIGIGVTPTHLLDTAGGAYSDGNGWYNACSKEFKDNIRELTNNDAKGIVAGLKPVTYTYKNDPKNDRVGFIAEDSPNIVVAKDKRAMNPMDVVAVLTKVVQDQQRTIEELSSKMRDFELKQTK